MKKGLLSDKKTKAYLTFLSVFCMSFLLLYSYVFRFNTSDYQAHIRHSLRGEGYSIMSVLIRLCYRLTGTNVTIVVLMALFTTLTVVAISIFIQTILKHLNEKADFWQLLPLSTTFLFISKICIPEWSPYYYQDSFSTQPWHNSTYTLMRLFGIPAVMMYFVIRRNYTKSLNLKDCILFSIFLLLTNLSKPNFLLAFAPVMLWVLIYDFVASRGKTFKNAFLFGLCVLITSGVLLLEYNANFPSDGDSGGIAFSVSNAIDLFSRDKKMILHMTLNYLFPIYVTCLYLKNRKKTDPFTNLVMKESWAMNILTILIYFFIIETGSRRADGNFGWGTPFFACLLFIVCGCVLYRMKKMKLISEKEYITAGHIYAMHVIFGVFYYALLLLGYLSWGI
jgi:hypothetical protein